MKYLHGQEFTFFNKRGLVLSSPIVLKDLYTFPEVFFASERGEGERQEHLNLPV